jgi:toxoflavin degrading enzyme TxDE-like protein
MDFLRVSLQAAGESLPALADFYAGRLGIEQTGGSVFRIGATELEFVPSRGDPFYHFAFLAPANRFDAAFEWMGEQAELLPGPASEKAFDFSNWSAYACYVHDPAGNIVEVIVHGDIGDSDNQGAFRPEELLGFSELGLVVPDVAAAAEELEQLDLRVWDGTTEEPGRLAFVGEKGRTLILCPEGRGWLPTGRRAESHSVEAVLAGPPEGVSVVGAIHRIAVKGLAKPLGNAPRPGRTGHTRSSRRR